MWYGVDPRAEDYPSWNPFNYTLNNPIRLIDPTGMEPEETDFPPEKFKGSSWCDNNGCFNRKGNSNSYNWADNEGKNMGTYTPKKEETHVKFANAVGNALGMDPTKMSDPKEGPEQALNAASRIINVLSFGEGAIALKSASALGKGIIIYGMGNDANDLTDDVTGFDAIEFALGEKGAAINSTINAGIGIRQSFKDKHGNVGNLGDAKDLIFEFPKIFSIQKPK